MGGTTIAVYRFSRNIVTLYNSEFVCTFDAIRRFSTNLRCNIRLTGMNDNLAHVAKTSLREGDEKFVRLNGRTLLFVEYEYWKNVGYYILRLQFVEEEELSK